MTRPTRSFTRLLPRLLIVLHDLAMIVAVWVGLRWLAAMAGAPPAPSLAAELVVAVLTQGVVLQMVGLYQGLWRFASVPDLANLVRGALIGVLLIVAILLLIGLLPDVPRRVLFPYPVALVVMLGLPRVLYRLWKDYRLRTTNADAKRVLVLGAGRTAENLLRELASAATFNDPTLLASAIKALPITLVRPRPLDEAISTAGGVPFEALDEHLMLRVQPGVFCAGEMIDWEAPTGGYLLTASMATGRQAAQGVIAYLAA